MAKKKTEATSPFAEAKKTGLLTKQIAFMRSVEVSQSLMFGRSSADPKLRIPVAVEVAGVRGQSSHDMSLSEMAKKDQNPGKPNPQLVHKAILPTGADQLEISWNARILPFAMAPCSCDNPNVAKAFKTAATMYKEAGGFKTPAELYLWNIANARFTWRNRWLATDATVTLKFDSTEITFDPFELKLETFEGVDAIKSAVASGNPDAVDAFIERLSAGFGGDPFSISCTYIGDVAQHCEVYPSQEYLKDEAPKELKDVRRIYSSVKAVHQGKEIKQASMHSQKINAALRCIDIWHGHEDFGPVVVNAYAGDQQTTEILRKPKSGKSLYDIIGKSEVIFDDLQAGELTDEIHFLFANLLRGGLFNAQVSK